MQSDQLLGGRYRLGERLGKGGMSAVWRAHDEVLERDVAVKILVGPDASARRRILAEAKAAARLSHPHVTNVYDYGESTGSGERVPYVVMELLTGRTLARRLAEGPLPPGEALRICAEVADALAAAHAEGLVHRDVKPGNVMLTATGAKVLDFGIAAVAGEPEIDFEGRLLGTPAYVAPERMDAGEVLPASDVYALGLLVHQTLSGRLPWPDGTPTKALRERGPVEAAPLAEIEGVSPQADQLCRWCLSRDPADRPPAAEVARILRAAAEETAGPAIARLRPAGSPPPAVAVSRRVGRRRLLLVVGGALAAVLGMAGSLGSPSAPRPGVAKQPGSSVGADSSAAVVVPVTGGVARLPAPADAGGSAGSVRVGASAAGTGGAAPATRVPEVPADVSPTPAPSPTSGGPSPTPTAGEGLPVHSAGGVVTVRCTGRTAEIVSVETAAGYRVAAYEPGPAREARVVLESTGNHSTVTVTCANGRPVPRVKDSSR